MSYASSAIKRLSNEYRQLQKPENRVSDYYVAPLEENIFEWHFTLRGPAGDDNSLPYKDGLYHGALIFSRSYPLEPPDVMFFTRSGRFATYEKICSTISSYHKELWQPTYDVALTLTALRHFMAQEDEFGVGAFPKNMIPAESKAAWAKETWSFKCDTCGRATRDDWTTFMQMYPETSAEKEALVPKLLPLPPAAAASSEAEKEEEAPAAATTDTCTATQNGRGEEAGSKTPPAAAPAELESQRTPKDAGSTPPLPTPSPHTAAAACAASAMAELPSSAREVVSASPPAAPTEPHSDVLATDVPDGSAARTDDTTAHAWHHPELADDLDDLDGDGIPRWRLLASPLMLSEEEARQLDMVEAGVDMLDVHFGPILRAALRREAEERAAVAAAANAAQHETDDDDNDDFLRPPPRLPQDPTSARPEMEDVRVEGGSALELNIQEDDTAAPPQQLPPPQLAENAVFGIHTLHLSIPLRYLDRAIIWSFSLVVLILLRRAAWAMLPPLWSSS
ncbi:putative ubiquitin-conjugating enzyme [Leptomonas pyrrhocoris]|uniref:Putative ubiquitin-conjugating enzyme n=1 Tax=Leptomonas pyrrhocoris TaxID=157538 RepID=A0A0N0VCS3_LEPPY|nr:putative ubiquitin-conjugating enzyme [Leptomonas pyrrhocoris]XP_015651798.1 putative ubiquitin-conjugating enzyme [Leptomonas pyrrhocoris]KPA73358.1 putative ubiquitin-conjugating enzyme [Leptomonas pyrrhocoris]KPA73359.1 putative ubiquitin-conjugating enzyme [Leptomonas pyrrhocoris]|eukprot:XP_015651797.1 putative ubiquitin-conjugating enzyme [Leptomonas pyrrhocoris]